MTVGGLWQDIGAGENLFTRILRLLFLAIAGFIFCFLAVLPLSWPQQAILGVIAILVALAMVKWSDSYLVTLTLVMLSLFCTLRYGYWRIAQIIRFFHDPASHPGGLDAFFILCLLFAELYAFGILFLGYFQTIWPLRRAPVPLPDNPRDWPDIDVLIPTLNEPLDVVRYTVLGALNLDWPADRLHVYILDDGRRKEFERFAAEAGVGYRTRPDNRFAKAGNINAALKTVSSPFVAIFDCDHVPTRSFLQLTVGWFLRDRKLAVLQTPQHFYSPDPFERNLGQFRIIPNEGELFYGIVQDGNDFWNSSFFCGSCAVLRRAALDAVGGIAIDTVTEDAHTSLRMQMKGWNTAYVNIPQAAGLATIRLSSHINQRIRWARGMVQILRTDNPLFAPGLTLAQRLCYFNAMGHFLYAVPRLIFLTAPLIYLIFNHTNIPGDWKAIVAFALPHLALSSLTNSRMHGDHRHSFWNDIYETVLTPYILLPTMMALFNPGKGQFNVTSKGGVVKRTHFDIRIAAPFLVMLFFNFFGLALAIPRFFLFDTSRRGTVVINVAWCCFNIIILGVCTAVAREMQQRRTAARVGVVTPLIVKLPNGGIISGETIDISSGGTGIRLVEPVHLASGTSVGLAFSIPSANVDIPAKVISGEGSTLRVHFKALSIAEQEVLTIALYSRANSWLGWGEARESDNVLRSLAHIFWISMRGLKATLRSILTGEEPAPRKATSLSIARSALIFFAAVLLTFTGPKTLGQAQSPLPYPVSSADTANPAVPPSQYHDTYTLADLGSPQIEFHNIGATQSIYFALPQTHVVRSAAIHVYYAFSPGLIPQLSQLKLSLNGTLFATIQAAAGPSGGADGRISESDFPIPPELLVRNNTLTIDFIGHYSTSCEDPANSALWARVLRNSSLDIHGDLLPLADDLKTLPAPFVDPAVAEPVSVPVVFPSRPSYKAIQAAGIVTSYFGLVSESRPARFPVVIGSIPPGNVVIVAENFASLPAALNLSSATGPTVAMRTNPSDPYGKALIVTGSSANDAIVAAQAVAIGSPVLSGPQSTIDSFRLPATRQADDAPRWARTDQTVPLWNYASTDQLQGDGTAPLHVYFRVPPDLYYGSGWNGDRPSVALHIYYRYNSIPIGSASSMQMRLNSAFIGSIPLVPGQDSARTLQTVVAVPITNLRPFSNTLSFDFTFQWIRTLHCNDAIPANLQGSILRDSFLDLRGYHHWASMPNLEIFANAGFPFTRFADLSMTTVVLPPEPTAQEIEAALTLMGHFGRQTGFPALHVTVGGPDALRADAQNDFLVIGSGDDQPSFEKLSTYLPVVLHNGQVQVRNTEGFFDHLLDNSWWNLKPKDRAASGDLLAGGMPDALIEGIESPYEIAGSHSTVIVHLRDASAFEPFINTFLDVQQSSNIAGSVSVLRGTEFHSYRMGTSIYHLGMLPWWTTLMLWFAQVPWFAALLVVGLALLIAIWIRQWLRAKARARLSMWED